MRTIRRNTARILPVDSEGRVLLLHGWDPLRPDDPFWFTIGGAAEPGESLPEAAARELREEAGIVVDRNDPGTGRGGTRLRWTGSRSDKEPR